MPAIITNNVTNNLPENRCTGLIRGLAKIDLSIAAASKELERKKPVNRGLRKLPLCAPVPVLVSLTKELIASRER